MSSEKRTNGKLYIVNNNAMLEPMFGSVLQERSDQINKQNIYFRKKKSILAV